MCSATKERYPVLDSVRLRLTLWHVGVLALLLTTMCFGMYFVLRQNFYEKAGGILKAVCRASISVLSTELLRDGSSRQAAQQTLAMLKFPEYTLAIFDSDGRLLAEKPLGASTEVPLPPMMRQAAGRVYLTTMHTNGSNELRRVAAVQTALQPNGRSYTLVVSQSLQPLLGALDTDRKVLLAVVTTGLILAGFAGWFLARKSLSPVLAMSQQAHRIGIENLEQRLPIVNPRDELGHLATTLNDLLQRLSDAFSQQRQFMTDASHELRTPVSIIRTASSVILQREHRAESEYRDALGIVDEEVNHLTKIVEDMFQLARADAGNLSFHREPFYLDEMLREVTRAAAVMGDPKEISVSLAPVGELLYCGDEKLLRQMLLNLLDNAIKFSPPGARINLRVDTAALGYNIAVSDTGRGIPPEFQAKIFERFFRVEKVAPTAIERAGVSASGAGLGLAIAREIAATHSGTLELQRSNMSGSTFLVTLPFNPSL